MDADKVDYVRKLMLLVPDSRRHRSISYMDLALVCWHMELPYETAREGMVKLIRKAVL